MVDLPDFRPKPAGGGTQLPDFRPSAVANDFEKKIAGMTHEQIVDEYRKAEINSPYYNFLVKKIEAPQAGETPQQATTRAGGVAPQGNSKLLSGIYGAGDQLTFGMSDEMAGGLEALTGGSYERGRDNMRRAHKQLEEDNPGSYMGGQLAGAVPQVAVGIAAGAPALTTMGGRIGASVGAGALEGGLYGAGSADGSLGDRASGGATGAALGAGVGLIPGAAEIAYKGGRALVRGAGRKITKAFNPAKAVEDDFVRSGVKDRITYGKLAARDLAAGKIPEGKRFLDEQDVVDAEGLGQRVMVSDLGGDATRRKLRAVNDTSEDASALMRGAAASRQKDQGKRVINTLIDEFGDVNPKNTADALTEEAARLNKINYDTAHANPNAQHLWSPVLQRSLSSSFGQRALKEAVTRSMDEALDAGQEVYEPLFERNAEGLIEFTGRFRRPTGEVIDSRDVTGIGLSLRFWDQVKRSMDDIITDTAKNEPDKAKAFRSLKNKMVANIDQMVPEYKTARGTAKEFFDAKDASEAGANYLKKMNALDGAEARAQINSMNPAERQLFAKGFAAELINDISQLGNTENVNKLFKSDNVRMKIRDALGDRVTDQLEAFTHREMAQRLLGEELGSGSPTALRMWALEGLKVGTGAGVGGWMSGDWSGALAGAALTGGYRATQRKIIKRYADAMAELVTSDDPAVVARILDRIANDPEYLKFSRAAVNGMQGAAQAGAAGARTSGRNQTPFEINIDGQGVPTGDGRIEPRFAGGGLVKKAAEAVVDFGDEFDALFNAAKSKTPIEKPKYPNAGKQTVRDPVRNKFPGIYKDPRDLVKEVTVAEEDPALKRLFGVTRDDLFQISKRKGNREDILGLKGMKTRGSEATDAVKTKKNKQRLLDALEEAGKRRDLYEGMHGWYVMDPAYDWLVANFGKDAAKDYYTRFNTFTGMASPGSEVNTELQRGTAALMMDNLGRFDEFERFGGISKEIRPKNAPQELRAVDGHPYHSTSQAGPMRRYIDKGEVEMKSAKVPSYIAASGVPDTGFMTDMPVADAHFTRALGLPDTRRGEASTAHSMIPSEYKALGPWFRDEVAHNAGLESVPSQAILWGTFGPQTGVTTAVGAPKLELLAKGIMETARRLKITPEQARELVLTGKAHAYEQGGLVRKGALQYAC